MIRIGDARGIALLDVIVSCGVVVLLAAIAIPSVGASRDQSASLMAARHLASQLSLLRMEALRRNRYVAIRFDPDDVGRFAAYVDGDGDGVLQADIDSGVDPALAPDAHVSQYFDSVAFAVPIAVPAPDGGSTIEAGSDPIRLGSSNLLSFSPLGTSTSGTVYMSNRAGVQVCVRVLGTTGRVRILRFDRASATWLQP